MLNENEKSLKTDIVKIRQDFEKIEQQAIAEKTAFAEQEIEKTNLWIGRILVFLVILITLAAFLVIRNIDRNRAYQIALGKAKLEAEDLAAAKSRFLANMSHELRTPLNAILGFTSQLKNTVAKPEEKEQIEIVHNASTHLLDVVNEVLDYTKLTSNTIRIKPVDFELKTEVNAVQKILNKLADEKELQLRFSFDKNIPTFVKGDLFRVKQCLLNLLGNAIKFTNKGSVTLHTSVKDSSDDTVTINFCVTDTGIGMKPSEIKRMFQEFEQAENAESQTNGTGLGLPITKRLVELMGGKLKVKSKPGEGTSISFFLKFQKSKSPNSIRKNKEVKANFPLKVLIADDTDFNQKLLCSILDKYGMVFEIASDGFEAIALAQQSKFDALILDYRMPMKNGIEVLQELKSSNAYYANIPTIILSAATDLENQVSTKGLEPIYFLGKPFKEADLLNMLKPYSKIKMEESAVGKTQLNLATLKGIGEENNDFIAEMLLSFKDLSTKSIHNMWEALEAKNYTQLGELAHKLAPSCNSIGLVDLYKNLKNLEQAALNQRWKPSEYKKHLAAIKQQVYVAHSLIQNELKNINVHEQ